MEVLLFDWWMHSSTRRSLLSPIDALSLSTLRSVLRGLVSTMHAGGDGGYSIVGLRRLAFCAMQPAAQDTLFL